MRDILIVIALALVMANVCIWGAIDETAAKVQLTPKYECKYVTIDAGVQICR